MRELSIRAGECTKKGSRAKDKKHLSQADSRIKEKEKKRQTQQMLQVRREEALKEAEGTTFEAGAF